MINLNKQAVVEPQNQLSNQEFSELLRCENRFLTGMAAGLNVLAARLCDDARKALNAHVLVLLMSSSSASRRNV